MKRVLAFLLFTIGTAISCVAQPYTIEGRVIDKNTGASLAFVNAIVTGNPQIGTTADIDGTFKITSSSRITSLSFTYVGYKDLIIAIHDTGIVIKHLVVKLEELAYQLNEVKILPGVNPALRIIQRAIDNRDKNNPEKVHSFTYASYNKMYSTADMKAPADSINSLDSIKIKQAADTSKKHKGGLSNFLRKQYIFLTESVSKRRFLYPNHNYEEIIASRTSGLKESPFALLANQLQSFSFYQDNIEILGESYLNPITDAGIKRYNYHIEDTLYTGKDSVYVISFNPKKSKNFDGMKGVLYINTNGYALQNVLAQPVSEDQTVSINIQQKYEFINNKQWFPVQLNTDWIYNNILVSDTTVSSGNKVINPGDEHNKLKVVTLSYIRDIVLDTGLTRKEFGKVEVEIGKNAAKQSDSIWNKYRIDTLSTKEKNTYHVIDSIGKAQHFDQKLKWFEALGSGKLATGFVSWDLDKVLNYNGYENFRLGAGLHTNDEISKVVSVGGYGAYGTRDNAFKYGGDVSFLFNPYSHLRLTCAYKNDVVEAGGVLFYNDQHFLSTETYHDYFVNNMDKLIEEKISLSFDALRYFQFNLFGDEQMRTVTNSYEYGITDIVNSSESTAFYNQYQFTELGIKMRFAFGEKFLKGLGNMISLGTKYPIVWANITHGFDNLLNGEFDYTRYDLKILKVFKIPEAGSTSIELIGGYVDGNVPYTLLYNGNASFIQYSVAVDNSFETMRINEFLSSRYASVFLSHDFESYLFQWPHFKPHLKLVTHIGFGDLSNPANHYFFPYKIMDQGYYESGFELNNLLKASFLELGVGAYYRYGPYTLPNMSDNFAFKLTITPSF